MTAAILVPPAEGTTLDLFTAMNGSVRRLSHLRRYSSFKAVWEENVAEHSFYCGWIAWIIGIDINLERGAGTVDLGLITQMALCGDIEEALTGDIITIFKNSSPALKREIKKQGRVMADAMIAECGTAADTIKRVRSLEEGANSEAQVVKFADLLCVAMYARDEARIGNDVFMPVIRDIHRDMRSFREHAAFGKYVENIWPNDQAEDLLRDAAGVHATDTYPKEPVI